MNETAGDNHRRGHGDRAAADADWRPSMDADCSSPNRNRKPGTLSRLLAFHISHGHETTGQRQAELQQQLREMGREQMVFGQRLLELRRALGWTQHMAADELGVSARSVIRHEKSQHRTPQVPLPLLLKLRDVESVWAEQILAYLDRAGRRNPWLPSEQRKLRD